MQTTTTLLYGVHPHCDTYSIPFLVIHSVQVTELGHLGPSLATRSVNLVHLLAGTGIVATHCVRNNDIQASQLINGGFDSVDAVTLKSGILNDTTTISVQQSVNLARHNLHLVQ